MRRDTGCYRLNEAFQYVDDRFLDLVEHQKKTGRKRLAWPLPFIAAASICLFTALSVGVIAKNWFGLRDLLVPDWGNQYITIALSGYKDSPESQALAEWNDFLIHYDTDHEIADQIGNGVFVVEGREDWSMYRIYSYEMGEKLDEIVERYGLKLHTEFNVINQDELIYRVGGSFMDKKNMTWAYIYEDGTFFVSGDEILKGCGTTAFQLNRSVKGTFDESELNIGRIEDYMEWQYMTTCGEPVLLELGTDKALIFGDFEKCFILINVLAGSDDGMTAEDLQDLADKINFAILKNVQKPEMRGDSEMLNE